MQDLQSNIAQHLELFFLGQVYHGNSRELNKIKDNAKLKDLCLDSLEINDMIVGLEQEYNIMINDAEEINLETTIAQIKELIFNKVSLIPA